VDLRYTVNSNPFSSHVCLTYVHSIILQLFISNCMRQLYTFKLIYNNRFVLFSLLFNSCVQYSSKYCTMQAGLICLWLVVCSLDCFSCSFLCLYALNNYKSINQSINQWLLYPYSPSGTVVSIVSYRCSYGCPETSYSKLPRHYSRHCAISFCYVRKCELSYMGTGHDIKLHPHRGNFYRIA